MSLLFNDRQFAKSFKIVRTRMVLNPYPSYGGDGSCHPDIIPSPYNPDEYIVCQTPDRVVNSQLYLYERLCMYRTNDFLTYNDDYWHNPLSTAGTAAWNGMNGGAQSDFCLLYVPEKAVGHKWWAWCAPSGIQPNGTHGSSIPFTYSINDEGIAWKEVFDIPENPTLIPVPYTQDYRYNRSPSVVWDRANQKFRIVYETHTNGTYATYPAFGTTSIASRLVWAESSDGVNWTNKHIILDSTVVSGIVPTHPVMRYWDGLYWAFFTNLTGIEMYIITSPTGNQGDWSAPLSVLPGIEGMKLYRSSWCLDPITFKLHGLITSFYEDDGMSRLNYVTSELSAAGKAEIAAGYTIDDYGWGGSIVGPDTGPIIYTTPTTAAPTITTQTPQASRCG